MNALTQDLLVAGDGRPVARPGDVMAGGAQSADGTTPDAGVEEELHVPVGTRRGSMRSWPTTRLA